MWILKSHLDQNPYIVIYHKFNNDFKNHINFEGDTRVISSITPKIYIYIYIYTNITVATVHVHKILGAGTG
jgi:hypothetical protein